MIASRRGPSLPILTAPIVDMALSVVIASHRGPVCCDCIAQGACLSDINAHASHDFFLQAGLIKLNVPPVFSCLFVLPH